MPSPSRASAFPNDQVDAMLVDIVDRAIDLMPFARQFRYPTDERGDPSVNYAREAIEVARLTYKAIYLRLIA